MSKWSIAIPSYKRSEKLKNETLSFLHRQKINPEKIYVFVANHEELETYEADLREIFKTHVCRKHQDIKRGFCNMVVGVKGICEQRNFIFSFFPVGHHVISIDDDVKDLLVLCSNNAGGGSTWLNKNQVASLEPGELQDLFEEAYNKMVESRAFMWSPNLSQMPLHMKVSGISTNFGICPGYFFGVINRRSENLRTRFGPCSDDVERSIRYYIEDGIILHFRCLAAVTKFRQGAGGINSEVSNRKKNELIAVRKMQKAWPWLIAIDENVKYENGIPMKILRQNLPPRIFTPPMSTDPHTNSKIRWTPPAQRKRPPPTYRKIIEYFPILEK